MKKVFWVLKHKVRVISLMAMLLSAYSHAAFIKTYTGAGELSGAQQVNVAGDFWDVSFKTGSFLDIFGDVSSLAATTSVGAALFSQAILDQVFTGTDDTLYTNTVGCSATPSCSALTAYGISAAGRVLFLTAVNAELESADLVGSGNTTQSASISFGQRVWAVWSKTTTADPISLSAPNLLCAVLTGLFLVFVLRRRALFLRRAI